MFVDYLRNERGSTAIGAVLDPRAEGLPGARCRSSWDEVETLDGANVFTLEDAAARAQEPDPWPGYFDKLDPVDHQGHGSRRSAGPI